ncbi:DUF47 domain-containing protein [Anaerosacchariphilus polymeriproducens]|uniref:DUF47 family protein n=1 Tax=Anaerosacchariphilus polymeriproducens TaxID=1812858 RepID=A0A371ASV2_9FIRM|nr:DUF47 family protein [Anaerosacchariphilus polymeriproducens]RDU22540.1 DUF47 family protein [Anaerosacchariphilus polymeriproducens]
MKDEKDKKNVKGSKDSKHDNKKKKSQKKAKNYNYFDAIITFADYSCQAAELLNSILSNFEPAKLEAQMKEMHAIEHAADLAKHEMMSYLVKEFITPIDREDISTIAQEIDNVTDAIEDVLMQLYMYNIQSVRKEALEFSKTIVTCCNALRKVTEDFHHFKKSANVMKHIINVNNLEEEGDRLYTRGMRDLYTTSKDPVEIMAWTKTFDYLEKCCDACENVADVMESIIMKNT